MTKRNLNVIAAILALCVMGPAAWALDLEPGAFSLTQQEGRYRLVSNEAKVNDILEEISTLADVPVQLDENDESTVTADVGTGSLEKLINEVSQGYAIIYVQDESGEYKAERIVAAGDAGGAASPELSEDGIDGAAVVKTIMDRTLGIKKYRQTMVMKMNMMGSQMDMKGDMWMEGDKLYLEMTIPPMDMKQIMVSDGETSYTYMPAMNMVQKMDTARLKAELGDSFSPMGGGQAGGSGNSIQPFDGIKSDAMTYVGTEDIDGQKLYVLEGAFPQPSEEMRQMNPFIPSSARYWVSIEDGMPRRSTYISEEGQEMFRQDFSNIKLNPEIDPDRFTFEPPEGVQIIDMTEMILNMHKGVQVPQEQP